MLAVVAERIARSAMWRHALFLGATVFTLLFVGYHFGTFDQTIHIPFLKKYADPSLYPGDPFFDLRQQHYSFFWFFFQPFYERGVLEETMFVAHGLATYLTFWAVWRLSETLFASPLAAVLSTAAFAFPHVGFAGFPILEFSLLNRTFVLPFLLMAILLYLRGRWVLAYALLGVLYNLHVISVQFVLAMFLLDGLVRWRTIGLRRLALGLGVFVAGAVPVLAWKLGGSPVDFSPRPEWFDIVARGTLYNLFYLLPPYPHILVMTLSGLSALALFWVARRENPAPALDPVVTRFVCAALLILAVQVVTAQWLPVTIIVQSQIIRAGLFILIFGYLYFGKYLADVYRERRLPRPEFGALALTYVAATLPLAPLLLWGMASGLRGQAARRVLMAASMVVALAAGVAVAVTFGAWYPGIYIYGPRTAWEDAQLWARTYTPTDAVFITPPQIWWLYQSDWRVFSERSTVVTLSELLEAAFAPEYIESWRPRFEALAPGALAQFRGDIFENKALTAAAFYSLEEAELRRVAQQYGAEYLVVEKPHEYEFPLLYENDGFRIYALTSYSQFGQPMLYFPP